MWWLQVGMDLYDKSILLTVCFRIFCGFLVTFRHIALKVQSKKHKILKNIGDLSRLTSGLTRLYICQQESINRKMFWSKVIQVPFVAWGKIPWYKFLHLKYDSSYKIFFLQAQYSSEMLKNSCFKILYCMFDWISGRTL